MARVGGRADLVLVLCPAGSSRISELRKVMTAADSSDVIVLLAEPVS